MHKLLEQLARCVEAGKIDKASPCPQEMKGQEGADELARQALETGINPDDILNKACITAMYNIGEKFQRNEVYVPQLLIAARAMLAVMNHLKPYFDSGVIKTKGTFVIGTVAGDLHDIGKNLVCMVISGAGWNVVDLGVDVPAEKFLQAARKHTGCVVGLSALLTTTMHSMEETVAEIRQNFPGTRVIAGGAPVSKEFSRQIGADFFSPDPQGAVEYLNSLTA